VAAPRADHRRVDEQALPLPGRAQAALEDGALGRVGSAAGTLRVLLTVGARALLVLLLRSDVVGPKDERFVVRRDPYRAPPGRGTAGVGRRDLAEREVFGEAARRELLERAVEQKQESPPGGVGAPRAPGEEGRIAR
jgi:hypothetical protein